MTHHTTQAEPHIVRFTRSTEAPIFRAACTCGWSHEGTSEEVQTKASIHDLVEEMESNFDFIDNMNATNPGARSE